MRKVEELIARFVDDVIRTIREAPLEELDAAVGAKPRHAAAAPSPPQAARTRRPERRRAEPPVIAEITDPERLLHLAARAEPQPPPPARVPSILEPAPAPAAEAPESSTRPSRAVTVALQKNESIARAADGRVVIRRRKTA
jgi:hypothetical protein